MKELLVLNLEKICFEFKFPLRITTTCGKVETTVPLKTGKKSKKLNDEYYKNFKVIYFH